MNDSQTVLILSCPKEAVARRSAEWLAIAIRTQVRRQYPGAKFWAGWDDEVIKVCIQGVPPGTSTDLIREAGWFREVTVVEKKETSTPMPAGLVWGTIVNERLTRRLLHELPEGAFVVSNCLSRSTDATEEMPGSFEPCFSEMVQSLRMRAQQWERAKASGAANRLCRVLWDWLDFEAAKNLPPSAWIDRPPDDR